MTDDLIEMFAIKIALTNNGGKWAEHYTNEQREYWRQIVRDIATAIENQEKNTKTVKLW